MCRLALIRSSNWPCMVAINLLKKRLVFWHFSSAATSRLDPPFTLKLSEVLISHFNHGWRQIEYTLQIAALQLVEQGRLSVETPVSEYFPQFANPIVLDNIMSPNPTFTPAKNVVRVQHLINFTSGLFYPFTMDFGISMVPPYAREHDMNDPHSQFFSILKARICLPVLTGTQKIWHITNGK